MAWVYKGKRMKYVNQGDLDRWFDRTQRCLCCGMEPWQSSMLCWSCMRGWHAFREVANAKTTINDRGEIVRDELTEFCNIYTGVHSGIVEAWTRPYDYATKRRIKKVPTQRVPV